MGVLRITVLALVTALLIGAAPAAASPPSQDSSPVAHADKHKKSKRRRIKRARKKKTATVQAPAVQDDCSAADADPNADLSAAGRATVCLLNIERRANGFSALRYNDQLSEAAVGHAQDMVSKGYFAHDGLNGIDFVARILKTGYAQLAYVLGENLAWGQGPRATPREIVKGWMNSPGHRANVLSSNFDDLGVGVVGGAPVPGGIPASATYATEFGRR